MPDYLVTLESAWIVKDVKTPDDAGYQERAWVTVTYSARLTLMMREVLYFLPSTVKP